MIKDEDTAMSTVVESLCAALPDVPESRIRDCVREILAEFSNARIRSYLPILVARRVRAQLTRSPFASGVQGPHPGDGTWTNVPVVVPAAP